MAEQEIIVLYDESLEANRRKAWAMYFRARGDLEQLAWWGAELGEWLIQSGVDIPPTVRELIDLVRAPLPVGADLIIRRVVKNARDDSPVLHLVPDLEDVACPR